MFGLIACTHTAEDTNKETVINKPVPAKVTEVKVPKILPWQEATVRYMKLEGGFYGLITHDGKKYYPLNLAKEFQQHDALIRFRGKVNKEILTIQQWGTPFNITEINLLKAGRFKVESDK